MALNFKSLLICLCFYLLSVSCYSAKVVFSQDGARIYLAEGNLLELELARPDHLKRIKGPDFIDGKVESIARMSDGLILCMSSHHLVIFNPNANTFSHLYDTKSGEMLETVAYDPRNHVAFVTMSTPSKYDFGDAPFKAVCIRIGSSEVIDVKSRMVGQIDNPVFDSKGTLYFSCLGDLWQGDILIERGDEADSVSNLDPSKQKAGKSFGWLRGERIAPLARRRTSDSDEWNTGVTGIAITPDFLFLVVRPLGHVGDGELLRIKKPDLKERHNNRGFTDFIDVLSSIKIIPHVEDPMHVCSSIDGQILCCINHYISSPVQFHLLGNKGDIKKCSLVVPE